jgi:hypothetical protein
MKSVVTNQRTSTGDNLLVCRGESEGLDVHIVDVEYLDDCRFPESEQLLWEVEATAKVLGTTSLPGVDANRPDSPIVLMAFVNAHRWTRLNRLRATEGIEDEPLLGVWNSAIQVHPYQLEPVLKALAMPRSRLGSRTNRRNSTHS